MTAKQLSTGLLCLGALALGATAYLGSPWPGVALAALSLVPWGWEVRNEGRAKGVIEALSRVTEMEDALKATQVSANAALDALGGALKEHEQQINSLRSAVSLRGLGG